MGAGPAYRGPSDRSQYRMKIPKGLQPLIDDGIVDEVIRPMKSGKEAAVFLVVCAGEIRCAKVYKDAEQRGFHKLAEYQQGSRARGSRAAPALSGKRSRHGRREQETAWTSAAADARYARTPTGG